MNRQPQPLTEMGLPFVPEEFFEIEDNIWDRHHLYYPKHQYLGVTAVHAAFRGLHIVRMPRAGHVEFHKTFEPPEVPSLDFMVDYVQASGIHIPKRLSKQLRRMAWPKDD